MPNTTETLPTPATTKRITKGTYIEELRGLHKEMIRLDDQITKHVYHTWRSQQPRYPTQAENLTVMSQKFEVMKTEVGFEVEKGENGFEKYYENLKHRETWEVRGAVRIANEWLEEVSRTFAGMKVAVEGRNVAILQALVGHT